MEKFSFNNRIGKLFSNLSFIGQQIIVSSCINLGTFSLLPDCTKMDYTDPDGLYEKCLYFYNHFLLIWWLNFIMCSLSLTLSFDFRHSVIRSLVIFILTLWEFTFIDSSVTEDDSLMPVFVFFFRSLVFLLLLYDIAIDTDFRNCVSLLYDHIVDQLVYPFLDFLEDCIDAVDELPWVWDVLDSLDDISKFVLCTNV